MSGRRETDGDIKMIEFNWLEAFFFLVLGLVHITCCNKCEEEEIRFLTHWNRIRNFIYNINFEGLLSFHTPFKKQFI